MISPINYNVDRILVHKFSVIDGGFGTYNDNKIVATIRYKGDLNYGAMGNDLYFKKEYVIRELIKSNRLRCCITFLSLTSYNKIGYIKI